MADHPRTLQLRAAAHARWAKEPNRVAATQPARSAFDKRFERQVDPEGVLPPDELARRVKNARAAYFLDMARKSAIVRRRNRDARLAQQDQQDQQDH